MPKTLRSGYEGRFGCGKSIVAATKHFPHAERQSFKLRSVSRVPKGNRRTYEAFPPCKTAIVVKKALVFRSIPPYNHIHTLKAIF